MEHKVSLKKNVIFNIIKQVLKIAFPLITFPYVSRILLEENLGKYNFSLSVISYFALIAGLGISTYAVREGARIRSDREKCAHIAGELFTINLITTLIAYVALAVVYVLWQKLHGYPGLLMIQSLTIVFTTLGADWVNGIFEDYEFMTKRYIFVKLLSLVFIFLLVKKQEDYLLYAGIVTGSEVLANVINIVYIRRYIKLRLRRPNFRRHLLPLLILFANTIAITIYSNADITMLGIFKTDNVVGIYSVSSKMYQIAKNLINAIIVVTIPRLAVILGRGDEDGYNRLLEKTLKSVTIFMFPLITGMFLLSRECVLMLGGPNFIDGDLAVKILSLALIPAAINSVFFDGILIAKRKERYCLLSTLISAGVNILLNLFFIPALSLYGAAITTFIAEAVGCMLAIVFARGSHDIHIRMDRDYLSVILGCVLIAVICLALSGIQGYMMKIILSVCASAVAYGLCLLGMKNTVILSAWGSFRKRIRG